LWLYQDSLYSGFSRAAELRAQEGETNRLEMITARSQSMEIRNQLQQIKADLGIFNRQLQMLLNVDETISPSDTLLKRIDYSVANDSNLLHKNPSLGQINQQLEIAVLERKLEGSRAWPDFKIGYFSQTMQGTQEVNGVPRTFGAGVRFTGVQAGIEIPVWFRPYASKVKAFKIKEQEAQTRADYFSKSLKGKYQSLLDEFEKYGSSVTYYETQALPEAAVIIDQSIRSYKAGVLDYLDYVLSLGRALSIKQNYLEALNNYNQTVISIEFVTGKIF